MARFRRFVACSGAFFFGAALLQAPQATSASIGVTVKPPLPLTAYQGLACNVSDPRLKRTALSNGIGPEARVAAACWRLEWLSRIGVATPSVSVHASPQFPAWLVKRIEGATAAGHRLFGRFADVSSYEVIASVDPDYSCRIGKQVFDPRNHGKHFGLNSWSQAWNSGCVGSDYNPGAWTASILGEGGREFIAWTLIHPEHREMLKDRRVLGPTWFMGASSHEFVHSAQVQRALESSNGMESIGRWFAEGQAQYLGNTAASFSIGPKDVRSAQLRQLQDLMREEGVTSIDIDAIGWNPRTRLVWPAGYFAYEWLVAHYGIDATFEWWGEWKEGCLEPGRGLCWRAKAEEMFGMDADTLLAEINAYVNAQVRQ